MKIKHWIVLLLIVGLPQVVSPAAAQAAAADQNSNGACALEPRFEALSDAMPDVVGTCLNGAWNDPASGDVTQLTSKGALIWRKVDETTLFTDGLSVWSGDPTRPVAQPLADALSPRPADAQGGRPARDFRVDSNEDAPDVALGDGHCAAAGGHCTLRAAIMEANASPGPDRVFVPSGVYKLGIEGTGEDAGATGDLDITDDLRLVGDGPGETYVQGAGIDRVLDIGSGAHVLVQGMRIRRGNVWSEDGGGIRNAGTLTLLDANVSSNKVFDGRGGGIFTTPGSATVLVKTSVWHSKSTDDSGSQAGDGGGIFNQGTLWLLNATIANNEADGGVGGGILNRSATIVTSSTVTTNGGEAGGGIDSSLGVVQLKNSIVAGSLRGDDCSGQIVSRGYNLIQSVGDCRLVGDTTGNVLGRDPRMGELIEDGPRAGSRELSSDSPVIDAGTNDGCPADDLRDQSRPRDGRGTGRPTCDIGAIEYQP